MYLYIWVSPEVQYAKSATFVRFEHEKSGPPQKCDQNTTGTQHENYQKYDVRRDFLIYSGKKSVDFFEYFYDPL